MNAQLGAVRFRWKGRQKRPIALKVRVKLVEGCLVVPVPELYAAHLGLQPGTQLELRATRDGFLALPCSADDSSSGDRRARDRAPSRIPTGVDVARALGGSPRPADPPAAVPADSIDLAPGDEAALRSLVERYHDVLRSLPS